MDLKILTKINIFNLGTDEYCTVNDSISWITEKMKLNPKLIYSGGKQGWIGDNPFIYLCIKRFKIWVSQNLLLNKVLKLQLTIFLIILGYIINNMKIITLGLYHLGLTFSACSAEIGSTNYFNRRK